MKKPALLLTTFILIGACQEEPIELEIIEVENPTS